MPHAALGSNGEEDEMAHGRHKKTAPKDGFLDGSRRTTSLRSAFAHGRHKKTQPHGLGFVWLPLADLNCGPSD